MKDLEKEFRRLKSEVEEAKSAADKARGAKEQLMSQLDQDFECKTLKQARAKQTELETDTEDAREKFATAMANYENKWHENE